MCIPGRLALFACSGLWQRYGVVDVYTCRLYSMLEGNEKVLCCIFRAWVYSG
jgi:hypothetical protein